MSNNEYVYSIINGNPSLVIHADDAEALERMMAELDNETLNNLDDLQARFLSADARENVTLGEAVARVSRELGGVEVHASPENVPTRRYVDPEDRPDAPVTATQGSRPALRGVPDHDVQPDGLPNGVRIYTGPQKDNPQYQELYVDGISYPMKEALAAAINQHGHKFKSGKSSFLKFNGKGQPYTTSTQNEALVRQFISANAHLQQDN